MVIPAQLRGAAPTAASSAILAVVAGVTLLMAACSGSGEPNPVAPAPNTPPTANAGADTSAAEGDPVSLDGSMSVDPDGATLTYQWRQTSGVSVTLQNAASAMAAFQAPDVEAATTLSFELAVIDSAGARDTDQINVTVNPVGARVKIDAGFIQGTERASGVAAYLGVPYAAPPTGANRWRAPMSPTPWTNARDATAFGFACPQIQSNFAVGGALAAALTREDCLTLNVWSPATTASASLPVMVWIHGGGFNTGASAIALYDGEILADEENVVVVSMNYRLGPLGFLSLPALNAEATTNASGNYGLMDLIHALRWIEGNIGVFGGDPNSITVFGESAGAQAICMLIVSPAADGLIDRAVMQSGNCPDDLRELNASGSTFPDSAIDQGARAAQALGCDTAADVLACLRSLSAQAILNGLDPSATVVFSTGENYQPIVDGDVLPGQPSQLVASGDASVSSVIIGSTRNEIALWRSAYASDVETVAEYQTALEAFDNDANSVLDGPSAMLLAAYPVAQDSDALGMYERFLTDLIFTCEIRRSARALSSSGLTVFQYEFARVAPLLAPTGALHGSDIPYTFGNIPIVGYNADDLMLADDLTSYLAAYARMEAPAASGAPAWPNYDVANENYLELNAPISSQSGLRKVQCDLLDQLF